MLTRAARSPFEPWEPGTLVTPSGYPGMDLWRQKGDRGNLGGFVPPSSSLTSRANPCCCCSTVARVGSRIPNAGTVPITRGSESSSFDWTAQRRNRERADH